MRDKPLPSELVRFNHLPDLKYRGSNEWSSACPHCGGAGIARSDLSDRFRLFGGDSQYNPRVWCRNCGHFEWADQDGEIPSKEQLEEIKRERARLAELERQRISQKIKDLQTASYWQGWHDAMNEQHRKLWYEQGIIDFSIDYYKLGYCPEYHMRYGGQDYVTPTMTIPHWQQEWKLINIQHRLLQPPAPNDKYRQMAGLPAAIFQTEPDEPLIGPVVVVEGAKKAIVTHQQLGEKYLVIAVPSKTPSQAMLDSLEDCDPIYLMLDPDAYTSTSGTPAVNRIANKLGKERTRVIKLPVKPDDFFVIHKGTSRDMMGFIKVAKPL